MPDKQEDIKLELNPERNTAKDKEEEEDQIPKYKSRIELSDEEKRKITDKFFKEFEVIKKEREESKVEDRWEEEQLIYDRASSAEEEEDQQFDAHMSVTKTAVDTVVNRLMEAFMESEPRFAFSPRPEYEKEGGRGTTEKLSNFVDYSIDEVIPYREAKEQQVRCAVKHGNGILKWCHKVIRKPRKREEVYKGTPQWYLVSPEGKIPVSPEEKNKIEKVSIQQGLQVPLEYENKGRKSFQEAYPYSFDKYPGFIKKLEEGKEISIISTYKETVYNDPFPKFVELKNFYVRKNVEGNFGLMTTDLKIERVNYTWNELEELKDQPEFFDGAIDDMKYGSDKDKKEPTKNYEHDNYDVLECEYELKLEENDEKVLCILHFSEERKEMIGAQYYPYFSLPTQYNEMHIIKDKPGFYQPGLADATIDDNNIMDIFINLLLESIFANTVITPVVEEGSNAEIQFLERRPIHGLPMAFPKGQPPQFFNQYMKQPDIGGMLGIMNFLKQNDDGKWGGSSLLTGRESPTDPTAPATKTLALMGEANKNIKVYVLSSLPSFNYDARAILSIYYQITKEGRKFKIKEKENKIVGEGKTDDMFGEITRGEMAARTNVQSQAYTFAIDEVNAKKETLFVMQLLRQELLVAADPESVYNLVRETVKSISPQWKNRIDQILPSPEELKKKMVMTAAQGVALYVQQLNAVSKQTGQAPPIDPKQLLQAVSVMVKEIATPPTEQQVKEREKANDSK